MLSAYPDVRALGSYEALLADTKVDAVYIPLPNHLHKEWTLRALHAGKHVLCEKPLALNAPEAEDMAASARAAGRLLMEAFMYRFHPDMHAFVEGLREPLHVAASFGFIVARPDDIRLQATLGGGALLDVGWYTISVARWILGEPEHIWAHSTIRNGVDMTTGALLDFPGGATAALWSSLESAEFKR